MGAVEKAVIQDFFGGGLPVVPGSAVIPTGDKITTTITTDTVRSMDGAAVVVTYTADVEVRW